MKAALLILVMVIASWLLAAACLMWFIGVLHNDWWPLIPEMDYRTALLAVFFLTGALGMVGRGGGRK